MNKIEKKIYDIVKGKPRLKRFIRNVYQSLFDILPDKKDWSANDIKSQPRSFFGFHDVSPFSFDEKYILSYRVVKDLKMPEKGEELEIGFWDSAFETFTHVGNTVAWNFHKGSRLQWIGKTHFFIYNDYADGRLISRIKSADDSEYERIIAFPIDSISPDGRYATSFSYERLNRYMPGYGYIYNDSEAFFSENASEHAGLYLIELESGERKLIVTLHQLADMQYEKTMEHAHHFVTHSEFSPDSKKISFLHRWTYEDPNKRYSRLATCNLDGSDIHLSKTTGMVSHYVWDEKRGILAYCQVDGIDGHYLFPDYKMQESKRVAIQLNSDGHQSFLPDHSGFVTDTYPDRRRRAKLYLCLFENGECRKIADLKSLKKYQSPSIYKHWACDLHPRISPLGRYVCFDSVHTGVRSLCIMNIEGLY